MAFFGYPHAVRATAQGIHFRSTAIVQSVSGDARDVPLTTEFLRWSYGLGAIKVAHFSEMTHVLQLGLRQHAAAYSGAVYKRQLIWPKSIDFCDSKNARHKRNVAGSCRKSTFMQMSQAFRPMSCRFEKLRRFRLSQPRLLHSLRALQNLLFRQQHFRLRGDTTFCCPLIC